MNTVAMTKGDQPAPLSGGFAAAATCQLPAVFFDRSGVLPDNHCGATPRAVCLLMSDSFPASRGSESADADRDARIEQLPFGLDGTSPATTAAINIWTASCSSNAVNRARAYIDPARSALPNVSANARSWSTRHRRLQRRDSSLRVTC